MVLNFFDPDVRAVRAGASRAGRVRPTPALGADGVELYTVVNCAVTPSRWPGSSPTTAGSWPIVYDGDGSIADAFGVAQVPETWIVDPDGIVQYRAIGPVTDQQLLGALTALRAREGQ